MNSNHIKIFQVVERDHIAGSFSGGEVEQQIRKCKNKTGLENSGLLGLPQLFVWLFNFGWFTESKCLYFSCVPQTSAGIELFAFVLSGLRASLPVTQA